MVRVQTICFYCRSRQLVQWLSPLSRCDFVCNFICNFVRKPSFLGCSNPHKKDKCKKAIAAESIAIQQKIPKALRLRDFSLWWRWGELNPCPKAHPCGFLRAQTFLCHSLPCRWRAKPAGSVASLCMVRAKLSALMFTADRRLNPGPRSFRVRRLPLLRQRQAQ